MQLWVTETGEHQRPADAVTGAQLVLGGVFYLCTIPVTPVTVSPLIQTSSSTWLT
jgi:hypothetical protein